MKQTEHEDSLDPVVVFLEFAHARTTQKEPWFTLADFLQDFLDKFSQDQIDILDDMTGHAPSSLFARKDQEYVNNRDQSIRLNMNGYLALSGHWQVVASRRSIDLAAKTLRIAWMTLFAAVATMLLAVIFNSQ
ncbi:MAG: hypothetical protein GF398_13315 [Chitinivibrionales bacterium]|nr:hypothetical protein [Chitinivibrionales bacterium]